MTGVSTDNYTWLQRFVYEQSGIVLDDELAELHVRPVQAGGKAL